MFDNGQGAVIGALKVLMRDVFVGNSAWVIRICNHPFHCWLQALGAVSPFDKDRVASMVVRDVS